MQMAAGIEVDAFGLTHVGKVRKVNQDHFLVAALHKVVEVAHTSLPQRGVNEFDSGARALLLMVADGVGGRRGGEEASSLALEMVIGYVSNSMRCFYKLDEPFQQDLLEELARSVQQSHTALRAQAQQAPEQAGMATTLTMAHVLWPRAYVVQIGDSRCYHLRELALTQITIDQTMAQELFERGALTREDLARSPLSNVLTRAVGGDSPELMPVIAQVELAPGDALVLCSDGLTKHVPDEEIAAVAHGAESAQVACERLVGAALAAGGSDNVTVVVGRF